MAYMVFLSDKSFILFYVNLQQPFHVFQKKARGEKLSAESHQESSGGGKTSTGVDKERTEEASERNETRN
jgi:hypothetical protein